VWAVIGVDHRAADVDTGQGRDPLRVGGGDAPGDPTAHAVAGDRDRPAADLLEPVEVGAAAERAENKAHRAYATLGQAPIEPGSPLVPLPHD
jgi:hypothetical protein